MRLLGLFIKKAGTNKTRIILSAVLTSIIMMLAVLVLTIGINLSDELIRIGQMADGDRIVSRAVYSVFAMISVLAAVVMCFSVRLAIDDDLWLIAMMKAIGYKTIPAWMPVLTDTAVVWTATSLLTALLYYAVIPTAAFVLDKMSVETVYLIPVKELLRPSALMLIIGLGICFVEMFLVVCLCVMRSRAVDICDLLRGAQQ